MRRGSHLVLEDQVLPQAAERLGEGEQSLVAQRLPVVLHHHDPASQLRTHIRCNLTEPLVTYTRKERAGVHVFVVTDLILAQLIVF